MSCFGVGVEWPTQLFVRPDGAPIMRAADLSGPAMPADKLNDGYPASACVLNPARWGGEGRS